MNITKNPTKKTYKGSIAYYSAVKQGWGDNRGMMKAYGAKKNKYGLLYWRYGGDLYYKVGKATCIRVSTAKKSWGGMILFSGVGKNRGKAYIVSCFQDHGILRHRVAYSANKVDVYNQWKWFYGKISKTTKAN